jgi:hypothetical protein
LQAHPEAEAPAELATAEQLIAQPLPDQAYVLLQAQAVGSEATPFVLAKAEQFLTHILLSQFKPLWQLHVDELVAVVAPAIAEQLISQLLLTK